MIRPPDPGGDFEFLEGYLPPHHADLLLKKLWHDLEWKSQEIQLFGKNVLQPRLTSWCSDPGVTYQYSGLRLPANPWHHDLDQLRNLLQESLGQRFNSVLINAYRNGRDSMGWHADNEPELGDQPMIASVSLGETRRMLFRPVSGGKSLGIDLGHGSLLVMKGDSQKNWKHSIPKSAREMELRINLTFRAIQDD